VLNSERKFGHLERLHPDIAVVSECRIDDPGRKGLAVICYNGRRIGELGPSIAQKWFAPLRLTNGDQVIQVVGVWLNEASDYVQPTIAAWETLRPFQRSWLATSIKALFSTRRKVRGGVLPTF